MSAAAIATKTAEIKNEFMTLIDDDTEYTLAEMKAILGDVFKTKNAKKASKKAKSSSSSDNSDEETSPKKKAVRKSNKTKDGDVKVKKVPNAYNRYVKEKMPEFKKENPETPATGLMSLIGASWKLLSKEEKDAYKAPEVTTATEVSTDEANDDDA